MKVIMLAGSHPRHSAIARTLHEAGVLVGLVIEERGLFVPSTSPGESDEIKRLINLHFNKLNAAERKFFGRTLFPDVDKIKIVKDELNSEKIQKFIKRIDPDLLLSYGVHMLSDATINSCKGEAWNIHGGLSPWYKGCITHFWPSYFLEPQMTGMTIHELTWKLDGGDVVHQNKAELVMGDGIHDLACRAVSGIQNELPILLNLLNNAGCLKTHKHKTTGKIWNAKDWRPEHLRLIYTLYDDKIVDMVLRGELTGRMPKLHRQF